MECNTKKIRLHEDLDEERLEERLEEMDNEHSKEEMEDELFQTTFDESVGDFEYFSELLAYSKQRGRKLEFSEEVLLGAIDAQASVACFELLLEYFSSSEMWSSETLWKEVILADDEHIAEVILDCPHVPPEKIGGKLFDDWFSLNCRSERMRAVFEQWGIIFF